MEYIYGALLLHSAGKPVEEDSLSDVLEATGEDIDESRVKALVAALEDVDIDEAIEKSAAAPAPAAAPDTEQADEEEHEAEEEEEVSEEEQEQREEEAAEGLSGLFDE